MRHIQNKSTEEISKAVDAMSESVFERRLDSELAIIDGALRDKDVRTALKLLPGKELLGKLAPMAGCKNGTDLMRSIKRNLAVTDFAEVSALSQSIKRRIN